MKTKHRITKMEKSTTIHYLVWISVVLACVLGFMVQVVNISKRHLEYQTRTLVELDSSDEIQQPSTSSCVRINDILQYDKVSSVYNRSGLRHWKIGTKWDHFYRDTSDWSLKNWFNFTPTSKEVYGWCASRLPDFSFRHYSPDQCSKHSEIVKYFDRKYVCYQFIPKFSDTKSIGMIGSTMAPSSSGVIYRIDLNSRYIKTYQFLSISLHSHDSSHLYDTVHGSTLKVSAVNNHFKLDAFYQEVEQVRMRVPYDTQCVDIPDGMKTGAEYLLREMNQRSMEKLNKVIPFLPMFDDSLNQTLFNDLDFRNQSMTQFLRGILKSQIQLVECKTKYFITKVIPSTNYVFSISVHWPQDKKISVTYVPQSETIDYVIYIGSCVGMWFGLSAVSVIDMAKFLSKSFIRPPTPSINYVISDQMKTMMDNLIDRNQKLENGFARLRYRFNVTQ